MRLDRLSVLIPLLGGPVGCVTGASETPAPSFVTDLPPDDTDGILIEWRRCLATAPCMRGDADGKAYALGFVDSPSLVRGEVAGKAVDLALDPASVYRLGDHAIEMTFKGKDTLLQITWNELEQKLIGHALVLDP
jgi:hypothetical protein